MNAPSSTSPGITAVTAPHGPDRRAAVGAERIGNRWLTRMVLCAAALHALCIGCASNPTHLVESDVPVPSGMKVRYSADLKRDGGRLSGGWFVLWGEITDVTRTANRTVAQYQVDGWTLEEMNMLPMRAALRFTKDTRIVHVDIDARRIDPDSSSATVTVRSITEVASEG